MDSSTLIKRLETAKSSFQNLELQLADPDVASDPKQLETIARERSRLEPLVNDYLKRKMLKLVFEKEVLRTDQFIGKIFSQSKFRSNVSEEISKKSKVPEKYIFIDVSTATSVPTTSSKKTLSEITIISKTAKKKTVQKIRAGELPLMNSILGYMDIIRIYTTGKYKEKVSQAVNTIFEKESR